MNRLKPLSQMIKKILPSAPETHGLGSDPPFPCWSSTLIDPRVREHSTSEHEPRGRTRASMCSHSTETPFLLMRGFGRKSDREEGGGGEGMNGEEVWQFMQSIRPALASPGVRRRHIAALAKS